MSSLPGLGLHHFGCVDPKPQDRRDADAPRRFPRPLVSSFLSRGSGCIRMSVEAGDLPLEDGTSSGDAAALAPKMVMVTQPSLNALASGQEWEGSTAYAPSRSPHLPREELFGKKAHRLRIDLDVSVPGWTCGTTGELTSHSNHVNPLKCPQAQQWLLCPRCFYGLSVCFLLREGRFCFVSKAKIIKHPPAWYGIEAKPPVRMTRAWRLELSACRSRRGPHLATGLDRFTRRTSRRSWQLSMCSSPVKLGISNVNPKQDADICVI